MNGSGTAREYTKAHCRPTHARMSEAYSSGPIRCGVPPKERFLHSFLDAHPDSCSIAGSSPKAVDGTAELVGGVLFLVFNPNRISHRCISLLSMCT